MMSGGGAGHSPPAAGGPARHVPVLRVEALAALDLRADGCYLDATFGAGGYSREILAVAGTRVLALDRDPDAVRDGAALVAASAGRLTLVEARFGKLDRIAYEHGVGRRGEAALDGIVLDIGVSSMQLDAADRGFSFRRDGPLDMRMETSGRTAAEIVNEADEETLAGILYHYGEERASRRLARAIIHDRTAAPFTSTRALGEMIARVLPARPTDVHPATRAFQAIRIAVNDELGELVRGLEAAERALKTGGRLAVVTFHSLEDRIVKQFFSARSGRGGVGSRHLPGEPTGPAATFTVPGRQPIAPSAAEIHANPRARSAKLRFAVRTQAPAAGAPAAVRALAELPSTRQGRR
jgi:16S rRNA (cytosine1402-N4)-methyltransferase